MFKTWFLSAVSQLRVEYEYFKNRLHYNAIANPNKIIWITHKDIKLKMKDEIINWKGDPPGTILKSFENKKIRNFSLEIQEEQLKYRAVCDHFGKGIPWDKTELFSTYYRERLQKGVNVWGCSTLENLVKRYNSRIQTLYEDMRINGFRVPSKKHPDIESLYVHIGPKGEIIYTKDGNHRLAIARYLGISLIPCKVWYRHEEWQKVREIIAQTSRSKANGKYPLLLNHPDLQDINPVTPE